MNKSERRTKPRDQITVMHVDEIKALAQQAHEDAAVRERLFATMHGDGFREATHAAWALTHLPMTDNVYIEAHREDLVRLALSTPHIPLRRISLTLLERLEWGVEEVRTDLLDFCLEHLLRSEEPYGVRAMCVKLAYYQCRHYPELCGELYRTLTMMEQTDMGSGLRHTRGKIMKLLSQNA